MTLRNREIIALLLALMLLLLGGCSAERETPKSGFSSVKELAGKRIGVQTGTKFDIIAQNAIESPKLEYFNATVDCPLALNTGKIDAYLMDEPIARSFFPEYPNQYCLAVLQEDQYGFVFPKTEEGARLRDQFNEFLAEIKANGTFSELDSIWFGDDESRKVVDTDSLTGENGTLQFATESGGPPFVYVKDGKLVGYEIDLAVRFCKDYGYALDMTDIAFTGLLASVTSGKSDFGATCISITDERKESLYFSEPDYVGGIVLVVKDQEESQEQIPPKGGFTSIQDLSSKRIGVITGSVFDKVAEEHIPNANIEYYNTTSDLAVALQANRIDAYLTDEPIFRSLSSSYPTQYALTLLTNDEYAFIFPKNSEKHEKICAEINEFIVKCREDGTLDTLKEKWFTGDISSKTIELDNPVGKNGTLRVAISSEVAFPFIVLNDGVYGGYDMEIVTRFCLAYGYSLEIIDSNFTGLITAVSTGKADMGASCITVTEERKESLLFSEPDYEGGVVVVVNSAAPAVTQTDGGIAASFEKTFIRENRWRLFINGIGVTVLITVLSAAFGTGIGFLLYLVYRKKDRIFNYILDILMDILEKTPVVVILMILYYVIFGSSDLAGIWVAVIGFSILFACGFVRTVDIGVKAIDNGQNEAALALGFTDTKTFLDVILPQAAGHFLPNYRGSIVALLKDTAIVGYIAVQDLTKVGDIVRSRTYEAFFPLIATAVIYFLLAWLLTLIVSHAEFNFNPKNRSKEKILKGVKVK